MKGDKGVCVSGIGINEARKTKYDTQKHVLDAFNIHRDLKVIPEDYEVYRCKTCRMWHFGSPEQIKLYAKIK